MQPTPAPHATIFMAMSLDGRIAGPGGDLSFLSQVELEGEDYGFQSFFSEVDALVMGRKSYEAVLSFGGWPYGDKPVIVLSESLAGQPSPRPSVRFAAGDIAELAALLAAEGHRHLYVDGGTVARGFIASQLCDTMIVSIVPTILGAGPRLFDDHEGAPLPTSRWQLIWTERYASGLVQLCYARPDYLQAP